MCLHCKPPVASFYSFPEGEIVVTRNPYKANWQACKHDVLALWIFLSIGVTGPATGLLQLLLVGRTYDVVSSRASASGRPPSRPSSSLPASSMATAYQHQAELIYSRNLTEFCSAPLLENSLALLFVDPFQLRRIAQLGQPRQSCRNQYRSMVAGKIPPNIVAAHLAVSFIILVDIVEDR